VRCRYIEARLTPSVVAIAATAFELGQGGEDMEHQLAAGGGGVDCLLEAADPTPRSARPVTVSTRCRSEPAEAVEFPDDQGVAGAELVQELLEGEPVAAGAAGGLGEHPIAAGTLQGVDLKLRLLVGGGDAGIAEQMSPCAGASQNPVAGLVVRR
jgi:hypothetical protein